MGLQDYIYRNKNHYVKLNSLLCFLNLRVSDWLHSTFIVNQMPMGNRFNDKFAVSKHVL